MDRKYILIGFIILIAILIGILNIAKTTVPYTETVCQDIQVPYSVNECSNVQVPYSYDSCVSVDYLYNQEGGWTQFSSGFFSSTPAKVTCEVKNLQDRGGLFTIRYGFMVNAIYQTKTRYEYIRSMGSITLIDYYYGTVNVGVCSVIPPTHQDCDSVIKYRTEQKCEDVVKIKTESKCDDVIRYKEISMWDSFF